MPSHWDTPCITTHRNTTTFTLNSQSESKGNTLMVENCYCTHCIANRKGKEWSKCVRKLTTICQEAVHVF